MTRALIVHSGNMLGGVETVLMELARLARTREPLSLEFALAFDGAFAERLRGEGASVVILGPARFSRPLEIWKMRRRLAVHLESARPDVAITQSAWSHAACSMPLSWLNRRFTTSWTALTGCNGLRLG